MSAEREQDYVVVGQIRTVYGVRGWLKLQSFTEPVDNIFTYQPWFLNVNGRWEPVKIEAHGGASGALNVKFAGLDDRELAKRYINAEIGVPADRLPELADGEYYWRDLEGCRVVNLAGYDFGVVDHLLETGANDVLVVKANAKDAFGQKERMLPFVPEQVVLKVDLENRVITVDWDPDF
ncbi:MAG: ribosome maturation factor RimM [Gammaproteobacteria bacterium]|nr:ribosome maturation factor RimM [Gammaproteobacteria bacterium]